MSAMTPITVALDWTPNANHAGFYVAAAAGLYEAAGLSVTLQSPDAVENTLTPARQVAAKQAHLAVAPSESAISFATTSPGAPRLVAVAALLQGSTSAICTLASSGIDRPSALAGKRYASYNGRFEDPIVSRMVTNDGGDGTTVKFHSLEAHGYDDGETMGAGSVVASYLQKGKSDSTWIFQHVEGILAERAGVKLNCFELEKFNIPYGYSPVLLAHPDMVSESSDVLRAFLKASAEGYRRAAVDPVAAAVALGSSGHPSLGDAAFVEASATAIASAFLSLEGTWGEMEHERWERFVDFLADAQILTDRAGKLIPRKSVDVSKLFTNDLLPAP